MTTVILVVHVLVALALVAVVLLQRSEGGGLGLGGGGSFGGLMTGRGTANLLTRTTAVLATCFMLTSIVLAIMAGHRGGPSSILDLPTTSPTAPAVPPASSTTPAVPAPSQPSAPVAN